MSAAFLPSHAQQKGPLPLVIGVTGHRDLSVSPEDCARLEGMVRAIFDDLETRYPATPIVLLSPLAEGADRLVARVALARGARLVVPLPVPRSFYQSDAEFQELIAQATWFEIDRDEGRSPGSGSEPGGAAGPRYRELGAYIARNCQILIALWDGKDTGKPGGTWEVVQRKLEGEIPTDPEGCASIDLPETGPVFQIITPRQTNPVPKDAFMLSKQYPDRATPAVYEQAYANLDAFNRSVVDDEAILSSERAKVHRRMFKAEPGVPASIANCLERYAEADYLARRLQSRTHRTLLVLLALGVLAALAFEVHIYLLANASIDKYPWAMPWRPNTPVLGSLTISVVDLPYLVLSLASVWVFLWAERHRLHDRYLDYRALAEGLRVQIFWRIAGLNDLVADHYLNKQKSELDWIRNAIRTIFIGDEAPGPAAASEPGPTELNLVLKRWVEHQRNYYAGSASENDVKNRRIKRIGKRLIALGVLMALIKLFLRADHPLSMGLFLFIAFVGIMAIYARIRALSEHAKQYAKMSLIFAVAERRLKTLMNAKRYREAQDLIRALGREALAENADWVLLHRERPLEIPRM